VKKNFWADDYETIIRYFSDRFMKYGVDSKTLDWGSRESQALRFSVLADIGRLDGASVLDVGCGLGDLLQWFRDNDLDVDYTGIDITPVFIEEARKRFSDVRFEVCDLLTLEGSEEEYDYVFSSGIFYLCRSKPYEFMKAMVTRMFSICRLGLAFNTLSAWTGDGEEGEFNTDPITVLEFCKMLTPRMVFRHDYHPSDCTFYLYK
jgi:SAM-dependent methyltransferase